MAAHRAADTAAKVKRRVGVNPPKGRIAGAEGAQEPFEAGESQSDFLARVYAEALSGPTLGADAVDVVRRLRDGEPY